MKHWKHALSALLILMIVLPGLASAAGSYTGYINRKTYVYKKASTSSARVSVSADTKVTVLGTSGKFYKVRNPKNSVTGYVLKSRVTKAETDEEETSGDSGTDWKSKVVKLDWFKTGKSVLKRGAYGYLYDISTGITIRIKRMGGSNHADVEPATASDTAKLKKIAGGKFSWDSHAVILRAGGKYVACAINTMPHGDQTITNNNYNGQFCLHMVGSLTHGSGKVNSAHQKAITKAYNWAHS